MERFALGGSWIAGLGCCATRAANHGVSVSHLDGHSPLGRDCHDFFRFDAGIPGAARFSGADLVFDCVRVFGSRRGNYPILYFHRKYILAPAVGRGAALRPLREPQSFRRIDGVAGANRNVLYRISRCAARHGAAGGAVHTGSHWGSISFDFARRDRGVSYRGGNIGNAIYFPEVAKIENRAGDCGNTPWNYGSRLAGGNASGGALFAEYARRSEIAAALA